MRTEVFYVPASEFTPYGFTVWSELIQYEIGQVSHGFEIGRSISPEVVSDAQKSLSGWYYWYCELGCLPDSDPFGPFGTKEKAEKAISEEK